jgi:hypothetical protein
MFSEIRKIFVICLNDYPYAVVDGTEDDANKLKDKLKKEYIKERGEPSGMFFWFLREVQLYRKTDRCIKS